MSYSVYYQDYLKSIWQNKGFPSTVYDRNNSIIHDNVLNSSNDRAKVTRKKEKKYY